jgi:hypothetical protein
MDRQSSILFSGVQVLSDSMNHISTAGNSTSRKHFSPGEMVAIVVIIGALIAILLPAVKEAQKHQNPKGPHGRMIPAEPPEEDNRITVESGLSIVAPQNWDLAELLYDGPCIGIHARRSSLRRTRAMLWVQMSLPPDEDFLEEAKKIKFQGQPAYEKIGYELDTFEYTTYLMYVEREESWWLISIKLKKYLEELPEEFRPYLETIQFPENDLAEREAKPDDTE